MLGTMPGATLHEWGKPSYRYTHHGKAAVLQLLDLHVLAVHARGVEGELVDEARLQDTQHSKHMLETLPSFKVWVLACTSCISHKLRMLLPATL